MNILGSFATGEEGNELMDAYLHGIDGNKINNVISASGDVTTVDSWDSINDWKTFDSCDGPLCASDDSESDVSDEVSDVADVVSTTTVTTTTTTSGNATVSVECTDAQAELEASTNAVEKMGLELACEAACAEFEDETCGFLVNTLSLTLFALLAAFKY